MPAECPGQHGDRRLAAYRCAVFDAGLVVAEHHAGHTNGITFELPIRAGDKSAEDVPPPARGVLLRHLRATVPPSSNCEIGQAVGRAAFSAL